MENVPPGVDAFGECVAGNIIVVGLCVVDRSHGLTTAWARNRPSGLGDPDWLALARCDGDGVVIPEGGIGVTDAVGLCGLCIMCQSG